MPKISHTQRSRQKLDLFKEDCCRSGMITEEIINAPYDLSDSWREQIQKTIDAIQESRGERIKTLVHGFYLGLALEGLATPVQAWKTYIQEKKTPNATSIYKGAIRLYKMYEGDPRKIYSAQHLTLNALARMSTKDFDQKLLPWAKQHIVVSFEGLPEIVNLEGENC
jgi:hypothetical protein